MNSYLVRFLSQSWRDLWRNRRRTILTGLAMMFASFSMVPFIALGDGGHEQMIASATDSFLGHAQIQHRGYRDDPDLFHRVKGVDMSALESLLEADPEVASWSARVTVGALASKKVPEPEDPDDLDAYKGMSSEGVMLMGVNPEDERRVSNLADSLLPDDPATRCQKGCNAGLAELYVKAPEECTKHCAEVADSFEGDLCLSGCNDVCQGRCPEDDDFCEESDCVTRCQAYCTPARFLANETPNPDKPYRGEVVLGAELANLLMASEGDEVVVTTSTAEGRTYGAIYQVVGRIHTNATDINRTLVLTHHQKLSAGLQLPGGATSVVLQVKDLEHADVTSARLDKAVGEIDKDLTALSWKQLAPELEVFIKIDQGSLLIMLIILTLVVGVVIANVVTMSVMERTREFGVRLALGESPGRIAWSLLTEVMMLAALASVSGALIGEALTLYLAQSGLDLGIEAMQSAGVIIQPIMYPVPTLYGFLFPIVCVVGFSFVGALIPSFRMMRLKPVDALRFE